MTSKKRTSGKQTKKAVKKVQSATAQPLQQPLVNTTMIDCFCVGSQTTTEIAVAQVDSSVSATSCFVGIVSQTATTVTNTVKKAARKAGSLVRSAWNWIKTKVHAGATRVKSVAVRTKAYVAEKAAQAAIATVIGFLYAYAFTLMTWQKVKAFSIAAWNRSKAKAIALFRSAKEKTIALWNDARTAYASAKAWVIRTWTEYKPLCIQATKIAAVAMVLYMFVNAAILASCVIVAALGVNAYDNACLALAKKASRKKVTGKKQIQPSLPLFTTA